MATKIVTKNSSTAGSAPLASDLVQGELAVNVTDKRLYTENASGVIVEVGTNPSGDVTFQDNGKAIFGAGSDLQMYHDGTAGASYIDDVGTGRLYIRGSRVTLQKYTGETMIDAVGDGAVTLYHDNNAPKLSTTSTGIDVTGTATMDGLVVDSGTANTVATFSSSDIGANLTLADSFQTGQLSSTGAVFSIDADPSNLYASTNLRLSTDGTKRLNIDSSGDISFYEDTGTTPKFFWDASAESLGIGESSPTSKLVVGANGISTLKPTVQITDGNNGASLALRGQSPILFFDTTAGGVPKILMDSQGVEFKDGTIDSEGNVAVKIDASGNVGIGTSSPSNTYGTNLHVNSTATSSAIKLTNSSTGTGASDGFELFGSGVNTYLLNREAGFMYFGTSNTERMRIDSSGRVGIGQTTSGYNLFEVNGDISTAWGASPTNIGMKYIDGSQYYLGLTLVDSGRQTRVVSKSADNTGYIAFDTGASAAERMRIDSSGDMIMKGGRIKVRENDDGNDAVVITRDADEGYVNLYSAGSQTIEIRGNGNSYFNGGNVGIGTSSPSGILHLQESAGGNVELHMRETTGGTTYGASLDAWNGSGGNFRIRLHDSGGTLQERMRIDSSGNLLVGTTGGSFGAKITAQSSTSYLFESRRTGTGNEGHVVFSNANGAVGTIFTNGTTTSYNTSSDQRLKENIADADDAGSKIDSIQVRKYDWKADGSHQDYGMVAQELMTVAPEAVSGDPDSDEMMGVDYSKLVPMLIKEIQSLRNRVAQLEE